ncbi:MAG: hypothetical protein PHG55_04700, partial [Verrucomicrobiota bacterium]|nr:hypothetical protein [Verrucomicrobiota bacterium]
PCSSTRAVRGDGGWSWAFGLRALGLLMGEKSEPTGTSALPGGAWQAKSWCEMEVRSGSGYHPGYQTGTVWLPTLLICRFNVL